MSNAQKSDDENNIAFRHGTGAAAKTRPSYDGETPVSSTFHTFVVTILQHVGLDRKTRNSEIQVKTSMWSGISVISINAKASEWSVNRVLVQITVNLKPINKDRTTKIFYPFRTQQIPNPQLKKCFATDFTVATDYEVFLISDKNTIIM